MRKYNIDLEHFLKLDEYSSYILGLMWADGTLGAKNSITITGVSDDLDLNKSIFEKFGSWGYYYRSKWNDNVNRKEQLTVYLSNKELYNFLDENGYKNKKEPFILNKIPTENLKYWWRGYVDGDGCFYVNLEQRHKDFFFTSYYGQDWSFVETLCDKLEVDYKIINTKSDKSSCSRIMIKRDNNVLKFGNYLYDGYESDQVGYKRKYSKFLDIKKWKETDKYFKNDNVYKSGDKWVGTFNYMKETYYCGTFIDRDIALESVRKKKKEIIFKV